MELKGMYDDSLDRANSSEGTWTINTRNIVITKDKQAVKNEDGFDFYAYNYTEGATPIGFITLYNDEVVIFSVTTTSEIGKIDNKGFYQVIVRDDGFGFTIDHPISGRHHRNIYNEVEIIFTDTNTPVKVLNIDNLPFKLNTDYTLQDPTLLNNALVFPNAILPQITATKVRPDGGDITTGTIFFTGQYEDYSGYVTDTFPVGNPVLIINMNSTYTQISGDEIGTKTPNSVELFIENIDTRYKKIKLIVIRKEGSQYYAESFTTLNIHGPTATAIYTGTEPVQSMSMSEIIVDRPSYTTASSVLIDSDILYLADVGTKPTINIQKYVNSWKVEYIRDEISVSSMASPEGTYKDGSSFHLKRLFMHNEVYALYGVVTMRSGNYQYAFHLPGRAVRKIQDVPELAGFDENALVSSMTTALSYLKEDDAVASNVKYFQTRDTSSVDGTMGYWENNDEIYPNTDDWDILDADGKVVDTLRGQKVRHHKTPTIGKDGYFTQDTHNAHILGLRISNINLPQEIRDEIQNIEIFYAKRKGDNCTLAGRALLFFGAQGLSPENNNITSNAGNWSVKAGKNPDPIRTQQLDTDYKTIRMHPFDMLVDKTSVMPNFIYNNFKLNAGAIVDGNATANPPGSEDGSIFAFTDFTNWQPAGGTVSIYSVPDEYRVRGIYDQRYLPFNTIIGNIDGLNVSNRWNEEVFYAKFQADTQGRANGSMGINFSPVMSSTNLAAGSVWSEVYLTDLCLVKDNAYLRFDEQELVSTGYRIDSTAIATAPIFGGDGYYGRQGNILTAPTSNTYVDTDKHDGIRHKIIFFVETANPPELQYGDFYPKYDYEMVNNGTSNETEYPIRFHKDYTTVNTLNAVSHMEFEQQYLTRYFNRILRSGRIGREEKNLSWRTFNANDYYDTVRDRGGIVHLEAINGEILIQHEYGLYQTRSNEQLQTDISTVQVGTGDVFANPPKEILDSKDGYIGCNSKFVCGKFKGGYFTADEKQGKIFIMDNAMKEISNEGMYKWFRDNLPMIGSLTSNNPFTFNGLCSSYDEVNNRIIFVKKQLLLSFNDLLRYKGHYTEDIEFIRSLTVGDIVYKDGKYMRVTSGSPYEGIPVPPEETLPSE